MPNDAPDRTWQKNAASQIVVDSIFAALAAVLIGVSLRDGLPDIWHKLFEFAFSFLAFLLLARSAEGTLNALDEHDVRQYVYYLLLYNLGVILLVFAIAILLYIFLSHQFRSSLLPLVFIFFAIVLMRWIIDAVWIVGGALGATATWQQKFNTYLDELEDKITPTAQPTWIFKIIFCRVVER